MKRVLIVVAHPDDEVLGCGGTIAKHIKNKDKVKLIYTHEGCSSRYKIDRDENTIQKIENEIKKREKMATKVSKFLKFEIIDFYRFTNLIEKNFILQKTNANDARKKNLYLTDSANNMLNKVLRPSIEKLSSAFLKSGTNSVQGLNQILSNIISIK